MKDPMRNLSWSPQQETHRVHGLYWKDQCRIQRNTRHDPAGLLWGTGHADRKPWGERRGPSQWWKWRGQLLPAPGKLTESDRTRDAKGYTLHSIYVTFQTGQQPRTVKNAGECRPQTSGSAAARGLWEPSGTAVLSPVGRAYAGARVMLPL